MSVVTAIDDMHVSHGAHATQKQGRHFSMTNLAKPASWIPETGDHVPEDKNKRLVETPYGKGVVRRTRKSDGMCEVELSDWTTKPTIHNKAARKPPTLYALESVLTSIVPTVGCDVVCFAGRGQVVAIEEITNQNDCVSCQSSIQKVTIILSSWRLANRSRVKCFLSSSAVQVVRSKQIYEMDVFEKIEYAFLLKDKATTLFQQKQYLLALEEYSRAVGTVKYTQHKNDAPNSLRADLLVIMITCSNNAGTCSIQLGHSADRSVEFAKQALDLIDALEQKKGFRIHAELQASGYSDAKVFGEWKVKACLILANGLSARGNVEEALKILKTARAAIASFPSSTVLQRNEREVLKLTSTLKERRRAQLLKERRRAKAMFATNTTSAEDEAAAIPAALTKKEKPSSISTNTKNGKEKGTKTTSSLSLEWFQSPLVLSGLGIAAGVAGALLMYHQLLRKQRV